MPTLPIPSGSIRREPVYRSAANQATDFSFTVKVRRVDTCEALIETKCCPPGALSGSPEPICWALPGSPGLSGAL
eukprot:11499475-Alexandrium_andersonii.AAC.1